MNKLEPTYLNKLTVFFTDENKLNLSIIDNVIDYFN